MYVWYWYTHPKTVTHPSTNHAQHSVTSFIHHYATPSIITSSTLGINKKIDIDFKLYSENSVKITQAIQNYYYYYTHLTASFPARSIKQSAPCSRQVTTLTPHHSIFAGRMLFLALNQQCQAPKSLMAARDKYNKNLFLKITIHINYDHNQLPPNLLV